MTPVRAWICTTSLIQRVRQAKVEVAGEAKEPQDGLTTVALIVTSGGQKVLGMHKAVVRA